MNLTNYYYYFQSVIPHRICDDIIRYGKQLQDQMAVTGGFSDRKLNQKESPEYQEQYPPASSAHHREFDQEPLSVQQIDNIIKNKQAIYDLKVDKRVNKVGNGQFLEKFDIKKLPSYILNKMIEAFRNRGVFTIEQIN